MRFKMRFISGILVIVLCCMSQVMAGFSILVDPTSHNFGNGGPGEYFTTGGKFNITNVGSTYAKITIKASNIGVWNVGNTPGMNQYALQWKSEENQDWDSNKITTDPTEICKITSGESKNFDLRFQAPLGSNQDGVQNFKVTVKAEIPEGYTYFSEGNFYWKKVGYDAWIADWSGPNDHCITEEEFRAGASMDYWYNNLAGVGSSLATGWTQNEYDTDRALLWEDWIESHSSMSDSWESMSRKTPKFQKRLYVVVLD